MKNKIFHLLLFTFLFQFSTMAQSLQNHQWEDRVIFLFSADLQHSTLQQQIRLFEKNQNGLKDRKLVIYQITPEGIKKDGVTFFEKEFKENIYKKYNPKNNEFTFILIGLDGGEKMRSTKVVSVKELFGKIDRMPMRRAEKKY